MNIPDDIPFKGSILDIKLMEWTEYMQRKDGREPQESKPDTTDGSDHDSRSEETETKLHEGANQGAVGNVGNRKSNR